MVEETKKIPFISIKQKINLPFVILFVGVFTFEMITILSFKFVENSTQSLHNFHEERESVVIFSVKIGQIDLRLNKLLRTGDLSGIPKLLRMNEDLLEDFNNYLLAAKKNDGESFQKALEYDPIISKMRKQVYLITRYMKNDNKTKAAAIYDQNASIWLSKIQYLVDEDLHVTNKKHAEKNRNLEEVKELMNFVSFILAALSVLLIILTKKQINKIIVGPILEISSQMVKIKNSDEPNKPVNIEFNDELGVLVNSHNKLLEIIKIETKERESQVSKMASMGELAAGVGHEINNPLAIIMGNLQRIKKELQKSQPEFDAITDSINKQEDGIERISGIVDNLSSYSRADTNYDNILDIHDLVSKTQVLVGSMYQKEGIKVENELLANDYYIVGNNGKFQQILMILMPNAKDAVEGSSAPSIVVATKSDDFELTISVKDNGVGIPEEIREKIFKTFYTTKEIGNGTGIGLGVLSKIVLDMKGRIELDSKLGAGSTFSIHFPFVCNLDYKQQQQQQQQQAKLNGTALVVDDEEGIRELLVEHLEDLGLQVDEADDGDTALLKIKEKKYDYICTDMTMPRMSGDKFIEEAKKLPYGNTLYFVISGGVAINYSKGNNSKLKSIADGNIKKPFTEESIFEVLSEFNKEKGKEKVA